MSVKHKTICITGASAGIGAACALKLAKAGHTLVLGARRVERLDALAKQCREFGAGAVHTAALDVASSVSVSSFTNFVKDQVPQLDVLINNAGLAHGTDHVKDGQEHEWQEMLDTNVMGVLRMTRALLPGMLQHRSGHIVFLSSIAAHQVYEGGAVYAATKHAVRAIAQTLKLELNGQNIRVSTIDPGMVETEFTMVRFKGDEQRAKQVYQGLKPLSGEDIAACVEFVIHAPSHVNVDQMIVTPTAQASVYKSSRT